MSLKSALSATCLAVCISSANHALAATYSETGDAGDLPATAQVISGAAGTSLTSISGALTLTNGISESDMFEIYVSNPGTFSASNTAFTAGSNNFDSQLMLFSAAGLGVKANDDAPGGGEQSSLPAGSLTGLTAGDYYLLISGSGRYATSAGGLIFPNFTDGSTDPTGVYGPTGPGGGSPINGYTGNSNEGGSYAIALAGAQFVFDAVPEPATDAGAVATVLVGGLACRRRKTRAAA